MLQYPRHRCGASHRMHILLALCSAIWHFRQMRSRLSRELFVWSRSRWWTSMAFGLPQRAHGPGGTNFLAWWCVVDGNLDRLGLASHACDEHFRSQYFRRLSCAGDSSLPLRHRLSHSSALQCPQNLRRSGSSLDDMFIEYRGQFCEALPKAIQHPRSVRLSSAKVSMRLRLIEIQSSTQIVPLSYGQPPETR